MKWLHFVFHFSGDQCKQFISQDRKYTNQALHVKEIKAQNISTHDKSYDKQC